MRPYVKLLVVAAQYAEICRLLLFVGLHVYRSGSGCQRNQRSLVADILYTGCQNGTKFGTLIELVVLYINSKAGEL